MRSTVPLHRLLARTAAGAGAVLLLAAITSPVAAKEDLVAQLDAPIAFGTPPGTEILVGVTVQFPADDGLHPVDGSPIHLLLTGRDASVTRAAGAADGRPGHYAMRVLIPAGGVRGAQVVMHGTSDLPLRLMQDPFTFGPVRAGTAQVAPPLAPPITPWPRASAAAAGLVVAAGDPVSAAAVPAEPAVDAPAPAANPTTDLVAPLAVTVGIVVLASLAAAAAGRRSRSARIRPADHRPGA